MRFTLLNDLPGRTLSSPKLYTVPCASKESDGVIRCQFSCFPWNGCCRMDPIVKTPSESQLILSHRPSLTFCRASLLPQHVENDNSCQKCIMFLTCNSDMREDASYHMTGLRNFFWQWNQSFSSHGLCSLLPDLLKGFCPSFFALKSSAGEDDCPFSPLNLVSVSR